MRRLWRRIRNWFSGKADIKPETRGEEIPSYYRLAVGEMGVRELKGPRKHNKRIVEYHYATSLKATADEVPWCASFVCWCLESSGVRSSRSARARSYEKWGKGIEKPTVGCVVVLSRGRNPKQGHVGFYVKEDDKSVYVLGGNQSDEVNVSKYSKSRVLGYRVPG